MKMTALALGSLCLIVSAFSGNVASDQDLTVSIRISPNTIALNSMVHAVTVHADIPYSSVAPGTVFLQEIPALRTFPDDRGNLVAKFDMREVQDIVEPPEAILVLSGETKDDGSFNGTDSVRVKD